MLYIDSFVYEIDTEDFYRDIAGDVETRFDTSGYSVKDDRPLPVGKNKKVIGLMKDGLAGEITTAFVVLRAKMYAYRKLDESKDKRCKGAKKCVVEETLTFEVSHSIFFTYLTFQLSRMLLFQHKIVAQQSKFRIPFFDGSPLLLHNIIYTFAYQPLDKFESFWFYGSHNDLQSKIKIDEVIVIVLTLE